MKPYSQLFDYKIPEVLKEWKIPEILEPWSPGAVGPWSPGALEPWSRGALESRDPKILYSVLGAAGLI